MATPAAVEARSLFRALLRVQKRWPAQPDRPGRNIKDAMASRVRASFSNPSTSEADLTSRLQYGRQQLEALKSLQSNEFATKYPRDPAITQHTEKYAARGALLGSEAQEYLAKLKPSFFRNLMNLFQR